MITSWPAFGSAFAFSFSSTPSRVASRVIAGLRSRVTSPFAVEMFPFSPRSLPSSTLTTPAWARLLRFSQRVCTLGRCRSLSAAAGPTVFWSVAASARAARCARGGSPSRSWASTSTRANSPSLSFCAIALRTASFASSCAEESAHAWSSSSWRFDQTVSDETNSRTVASPNRHQTSTPRFLLNFASRFSLQPPRHSSTNAKGTLRPRWSRRGSSQATSRLRQRTFSTSILRVSVPFVAAHYERIAFGRPHTGGMNFEPFEYLLDVVAERDLRGALHESRGARRRRHRLESRDDFVRRCSGWGACVTACWIE